MLVFSEHAQDVLLFCVHTYWVGGTEHTHSWVFCVYAYCHYEFYAQVLNRTLSHICNRYMYVFAPGTLGILPDTYLVPVSHIIGLGVRHIDAI